MSKKNIKYLLASLAALSSSSGALTLAQEQQNFVPYGYQQLPSEAFYQNQMYYYPQQMGQFPQQQMWQQQPIQNFQNMNQPQPLQKVEKTGEKEKQSGVKDAALNVKQPVQQKQPGTDKKQQPKIPVGNVPMNNMNGMVPTMPEKANNKKGLILKYMAGIGAIGGSAYLYNHYKGKKPDLPDDTPEEELPPKKDEHLQQEIDLAATDVDSMVRKVGLWDVKQIGGYLAVNGGLTGDKVKGLIKRWIWYYVLGDSTKIEGYQKWMAENQFEESAERRIEYFRKELKTEGRPLNTIGYKLAEILLPAVDKWKNPKYYSGNKFDWKKADCTFEKATAMTFFKCQLEVISQDPASGNWDLKWDFELEN